MEASIAFRIGDELATFVVVIAAFRFVSGDGFTEVVFVDEVVACVVRRVDVDELDFAGVVLAQELQRVEVVSLDVQVPGGVPVLATFLDGSQGLGDGFAGEAFRLAFAGPSELVAFPVAFRHITKSLFQRVEVHRTFGSAGLRVSDLGGHVWEQASSLSTFSLVKSGVMPWIFSMSLTVFLLVVPVRARAAWPADRPIACSAGLSGRSWRGVVPAGLFL